ncbi:MAG: very short patch repair endonuclease [Eggerthellaceae bacterium]
MDELQEQNNCLVSPSVHKFMKGNKRANTKPELLVRRALRISGLTGYRLQWKVPGRPDVAWPGKKVALFVNGCFWHRCPYCKLPLPKSNIEYWSVKFEKNIERDGRNLKMLQEQGWKVFVVWECQLKKKIRLETFRQLLPDLSEALGKSLSETWREDIESL